MAEIDIEAAAAKKKKMKSVHGETEEHPLPDLIAADRYVSSKKAASQKVFGLRFIKLIPPGGG